MYRRQDRSRARLPRPEADTRVDAERAEAAPAAPPGAPAPWSNACVHGVTGAAADVLLAGMALRTVVAEDNLLVREGLVRLLSTAPDIDVVASCDDYTAVVSAVEEHQPDVVLTDIKMPPTLSDEGIRLARKLRVSHPEI